MSIKKTQRGAVLLMSLIVLLVLSVVTVTAARTSGIELLIANNTQFATDAFLRAEAGVTAAENYIATTHGQGGPAFDFDAVTTDGLYTRDGVDPSRADWSGIAFESVVDGNGNEVARYVIEYMGTMASAGGSLRAGGTSAVRYVYRITALGMAERGTARLIRTIYATT
jgi:type IV pilus assembly protein PilX